MIAILRAPVFEPPLCRLLTDAPGTGTVNPAAGNGILPLLFSHTEHFCQNWILDFRGITNLGRPLENAAYVLVRESLERK